MGRVLATKLPALIALFGLGALAFVLVSSVRDDQRGRLIVVQDVPDDVRAELDTTWFRFIDRFAGRRDCIDDVTVLLVDDVEGGDARYVNGNARIEIEIPTTPARFRESLAHELAHHMERTCEEFESLRAVLHPQFGGPERPWSGGEVWEEIPSELWAEAVVALVHGERLLHAGDMPIAPAVIDRVAVWGLAKDVSNDQ